QGLDTSPPVVVMTAWASIDGAVEAMRRGARDFIEKPWDNRRLLATLRTQVELGRALRRSQQLERENRALRREGLPELIAESPAMQPVLKLMERIGPSDANVLILGEHGTGKEVVARWLHAASGRAERPLVTVNLGAIPDGLFESEVFGHVKGAFTDAKVDRLGRFQLAEGEALFLYASASLPPPQQAKLLRVLETGEFERVGSSKTQRVNVRIVSATNADIHAETAAGRFRQDLLFRLNTVEIRLPPLRDRREDIPLLASHFGRRYAARYRKAITGFAPDAMQALLGHPWPGNARELDHTVERAVLMAEQSLVRARAVPPLAWRFRRPHAVDAHDPTGRRVAGLRRCAVGAGGSAAPDGLQHAGGAAGGGLFLAGAGLGPERRSRSPVSRAEQLGRRPAGPAPERARGDGAAAPRDGGDRCGRVCVRRGARAAPRQSRWCGAARTTGRAAARQGRGRARARRHPGGRRASPARARVSGTCGAGALGGAARDVSPARAASS